MKRILAAALCSLAVVASAHSEPTAPVWRQTHTFAAPEAKQAAAADERFVYAVTNDRVAKYDRRTGKFIERSTGEAHHLNSAFLWNEKLYCAHSNFPTKPERSEIFVLDTRSMQLTEFKDFGNYGGSLTWAVREEDAWWCTFALYGKENVKTFLVRFDDQWNERGRWTYPPEVLRQIGGASISGGIWLDGLLVVTDHDHPVLYRLRVPEDGSVLEFVDQQSAPITGQGIAVDPLTGGLVGIHRAEKRVVFLERR